jgi:hypothetical protein
MNYTKPEITSLASANLVIQGQTSKQLGPIDTLQQQGFVTVSAYESDE